MAAHDRRTAMLENGFPGAEKAFGSRHDAANRAMKTQAQYGRAENGGPEAGGGRLTAAEAAKFRQANAAHSKKAAAAQTPAESSSDGMTDSHTRINKKTGNAATVKAFKTPTRTR